MRLERSEIRIRSCALDTLADLYPKDHEPVCYLLCFEDPITGAPQRYHAGKRPGHYLGTTPHLLRRLKEHANGVRKAARITQVIREAGLAFSLTRVWKGAHEKEQSLKATKNYARFCPRCREANRERERLSRQFRLERLKAKLELKQLKLAFGE